MKKARKPGLLFVALALVTNIVVAQVTPTARPNTYAVVVGISQYQNPAIPRLMYADKDATLFASWLQSKAAGIVPAYQVKLLTNEQATIANVYTALDWLKSVATADDKVFIYFSGHGDIETADTNSQGYLLAWNSPSTNYRNNAISVAAVNETANHLSTENKAKVIIITDACHSGKMAGDFFKGRQLTAVNLRLVLNNQARLAACAEDEEAAEGPAWGGGRGVFSYHLLRGLQGMATADAKGIIHLSSLDTFLATSFRTDAGLALEKHKQTPVIDGSPLFPLAAIDTAALKNLKSRTTSSVESTANKAGLQSLHSIGRQPLDYFFSIFKTAELDTVLAFDKYAGGAEHDVAINIVADYIKVQQHYKQQYDSLHLADSLLQRLTDSAFTHLHRTDTVRWNSAKQLADSINQLREQLVVRMAAMYARIDGKDLERLEALEMQLRGNRKMVARFNEKFVQLTHEKGQEMINAYLSGDVAELEKRQYYYTGKRDYRNFLGVIDVATRLTPKTNYLHDILKLNRTYLRGVVDRLEITSNRKKADSLLRTAFTRQRAAIAMDPYAAYIHNELGNLHMHQQTYDSAAYHFDFASLLAPAWAIPWSNKIRLNIALNQPSKAKEAIRVADSLQPNLGYVNINAGLVMEKDTNWLAAEGYYRNAITQNNVHYLPFERLGVLYINMGKYALADSFLREAKNRKDTLAINDMAFRFGIELGGAPEGMHSDRVQPECNLLEDEKIPGWKNLIDLARTLAMIHNDTSAKSSKIKPASLSDDPAAHLLHHYLGRKHFAQKDWASAEANLKKAIAQYLSPEELSKRVSREMMNALPPTASSISSDPGDAAQDRLNKINDEAGALRVDTSCLLKLLAYYSYDKLEDHYMLAKLYEQQSRFNEALHLYEVIAKYENEVLMEQAIYKDYREVPITDDASAMRFDNMGAKYEDPIRMGGTIKAARLLEQMKSFEAAEQLLLRQVQLNRNAGYARQKEMDKGNFGPAGRNPFNHFWLKANYDLEAETYNFYTRVLTLFPREARWYRAAGLFLYDRLSLTYNTIPIREVKTFYDFSKQYAYPYKGGETGPTEGIDEVGNYFIETNRFALPATGEDIDIVMKAYDPLQVALLYLRQAVKFSPEQIAEHRIAEAIANLQKWTGNTAAAVESYHALLKQKPDNHHLRNSLLELLEANNLLSDAMTQLDVLKKHNVLTHEQLARLAYYKILSNEISAGMQLIKAYTPRDSAEKSFVKTLQVQQFLMTGQINKALSYIKNSFAGNMAMESPEGNATTMQSLLFDNPLYALARLHALANEQAKAFSIISTLVNQHFPYEQLLMMDPALARLRKEKKRWAKLMSRYDANQEPAVDDPQEVINYNTIRYRIPGSNFNQIP